MTQNGDRPIAREGLPFSLREFLSPSAAERHAKRNDFPHSNPGSVLVAGIGAMWEPGCWQHVMDMVVHTTYAGYQCWFDEVFPAGGDALPMADIGYMRDTAVMQALDGGFEFVCLVDSDVKPEKETLVKLLSHELTMVVPYMVEPGIGQLGEPKWPTNSGLRRMRWVCGSFMLFRPQMFNCPGVCFRGMRDDDLFFQMLWHYGIFPIMDTDTEVLVTRPPRRLGGRSWDERWDFLEKLYKKNYETPDRSPIDPDNPNTVDGVYLPLSVAHDRPQ